MAHPYAKFNEKDAGKARAKHLTKAYAKGGKVHSDEAEDKKLISKMLSAHDRKVEGKASGGRLDKYARGGAAKKKGDTNINIVLAPQGKEPAPPPMMPPPMPIPPPVAPPGGGPGGPPPGMMQRGGKVVMTAGAETGKGRLQKAKAYKAK